MTIHESAAPRTRYIVDRQLRVPGSRPVTSTAAEVREVPLSCSYLRSLSVPLLVSDRLVEEAVISTLLLSSDAVIKGDDAPLVDVELIHEETI